MALYKEATDGVIKTDTDTYIAENSGYMWDNYLTWLKAGNTPDPQYTLDDVKTIKIRDIKLKKNTLIYGGVVSGGKDYSSDNDFPQILNIISALEATELTAPVRWTTMEEEAVNLSLLDFQNISYNIAKLYNLCLVTSSDFCTEVNACTTIAQVDAIDITIGWPVVPYDPTV